MCITSENQLREEVRGGDKKSPRKQQVQFKEGRVDTMKKERLIICVCISLSVMMFSMGGMAQAVTWDLFYQATLSNTGPTGNTVLRLSSPNTGTDPYGYIRYKPDTPFALNNL